MYKEPKLIDLECWACRKPASLGIQVVMECLGKTVIVSGPPICTSCIRLPIGTVMRTATLPSHEKTELVRTDTFPPKKGEWFFSGDTYIFGCPLCGHQCSLSSEHHSVDLDGKVTPSFICPHRCGFHAFISFRMNK